MNLQQGLQLLETAAIVLMAAAVITMIRNCRNFKIGEALINEKQDKDKNGYELHHLDVALMDLRGITGLIVFLQTLFRNTMGHTALLDVLTPGVPVRPWTVLVNKCTIKGFREALQHFGPCQKGVAEGIKYCVLQGIITMNMAKYWGIIVSVFVDPRAAKWELADFEGENDKEKQAAMDAAKAQSDARLQENARLCTIEAIKNAVRGTQTPELMLKNETAHPFAATESAA